MIGRKRQGKKKQFEKGKRKTKGLEESVKGKQLCNVGLLVSKIEENEILDVEENSKVRNGIDD